MADIVMMKSRSIRVIEAVDITMVKAHCVVITAQVDMNFIVVCERIMELQPSKKMNLMNES